MSRYLTLAVLACTAALPACDAQSSASRRLVEADIDETGSILVAPLDSSGGAM